ncbi:MAG: hypothetical protein K6G33_09610 [Ruminococcus sp.]|uniref:hypothetical protein n=1 Tax=Ruminococcus sp. TaxID=41978 RepID=UPI0025F0C47C|nr:hypothetical protein [Ruminococcus sp.]MCR5600979.1 hypothetical protein [Ruminococcus sp.]
MNSRKKIVDTLKKADKASVEKFLAEESKKNEIFEKARRRANIEKNEYTDVVNGVEKYERRISMTRIASIAAAAVIMAGSIGGGAYLFGNNKNIEPDGNSNKASLTTESSTSDEELSTTYVSSKANATTKVSVGSTTVVSTVTTAVSAAANNAVTVTGTNAAVSGGDNVQTSNWSVSKEELLNRMINSRNNYDKFSSDFTMTDDSKVEWDPYGNKWTGSVYFDRTTGRAWCISDEFFLANGEKERTDIAYVSGAYRLAGTEYCSHAEYDHNTLSFKIVNDEPADKKYIVSEAIDYKGCGFLNNLVFTGIDDRKIEDTSYWNITGERNENGRKIITISGSYGSSENYRGEYEEHSFIVDVDAETGIWLNMNFNNLTNGTHRVYTSVNYKFGNDAESPITPDELRELLDREGYVNDLTDTDVSMIK